MCNTSNSTDLGTLNWFLILFWPFRIILTTLTQPGFQTLAVVTCHVLHVCLRGSQCYLEELRIHLVYTWRLNPVEQNHMRTVASKWLYYMQFPRYCSNRNNDNVGSFVKVKKLLHDKSSKAMYSLIQKGRRLKLPTDIMLKLFDSCVAPILLYGWLTTYDKPSEM